MSFDESDTHLCALIGNRNPPPLQRNKADPRPPRPPVDWDAVIERARTHPREARCSFFSQEAIVYGNKLEDYRALHFMVGMCDPPLEAVKAVVDAYPKGVEENAGEGTPLCLACRTGKNDDLIRFLVRRQLERCEDEGENDFILRSIWWFHLCDVDYGPRIAKVLLDENIDGARDDFESMESLLCSIIVDFERGSDSCYEILKLFLLAFEHETVNDELLAEAGKTAHPLHTLVNLLAEGIGDIQDTEQFEKGFVNFLEETLLRDPDAFRSKNGDGKFPIVVLVTEQHPERCMFRDAIQVLIRGNPEAIKAPCDEEGKLLLWHAIENQWPLEPFIDANEESVGVLQHRAPDFNEDSDEDQLKIIERALVKIIKRNPTLISRPIADTGRFAIHYSIENGWPVGPILEACPEEVRRRDPLTRLFPFQLAAVNKYGCRVDFSKLRFLGPSKWREELKANKRKGRMNAFNMTFDLLRKDPTLLKRE